MENARPQEYPGYSWCIPGVEKDKKSSKITYSVELYCTDVIYMPRIYRGLCVTTTKRDGGCQFATLIGKAKNVYKFLASTSMYNCACAWHWALAIDRTKVSPRRSSNTTYFDQVGVFLSSFVLPYFWETRYTISNAVQWSIENMDKRSSVKMKNDETVTTYMRALCSSIQTTV